VSFDFAVVPRDALISERDDNHTLVIASNDAITKTDGLEDWVRIALDDILKANTQTTLRRFLWKFGPDYSEGRSAFHALCEIHLASSRSLDSVDPVLSATSHFFPQPDSSRRLKEEFFGINGNLSQPSRAGEASVIRALVTHPGAASIPADVAAIEARARMLVNSDDESAIQLAMTATSLDKIRAQQFLDGFAAGLSSKPEILHGLPSPLIFQLLRMHPELVTFEELWKVPPNQQLAIVAYLSSVPRAKEYGGKITEAIIAANAWPSLPGVLAHYEYEAVNAILKWIDASPSAPLSLPEAVFRALSEQRHLLIEIIQQKSIGAPALRIVSALLDPRADSVRALGTKSWVRMIEANVHLDSVEAELRSRTFLLSIGLSVAGEDAVRLVREGFSTVYNAARDGRLDDETWAFVEPYLPWYLVTWDKCARLVRGVVHLFLHRKWPGSEFASTFITAEQFQRALAEAGKTKRGSRYISGICDQFRAGSLSIDKVQAEALTRYC
jgi:hypothetical protein